MIRSKYQQAKFAAREAGELFFIGHVCAKHPILGGKRRAKSGGCPLCIRARMQRPENRKRHKERAQRVRDEQRKAAIEAGTFGLHRRKERRSQSLRKKAPNALRQGQVTIRTQGQ